MTDLIRFYVERDEVWPDYTVLDGPQKGAQYGDAPQDEIDAYVKAHEAYHKARDIIASRIIGMAP